MPRPLDRLEETLRIEVAPREAGSRLDRFLRRRYPSLPQGLLHKLARERAVTIGGGRVEPSARLEAGAVVEVCVDLSPYARPPERIFEAARRVRESAGFRRDFRVLYEDDWILVLDKPAGLVLHPGPEHHRGDTLLDLLRAYLPESFARGSPHRPSFAHRLDRGTSGIVVAAKTHEAARALERAFREGAARKVYLALVSGKPHRKEGTIRAPIERTATPSGVTRYRAARAGGEETPLAKAASTRYRIERRFPKAALLRVELDSGRTHQIRVHLASLGCPVVGDGEYGDRAVNRSYRLRYGLRRVFLHAAELTIPHPADGKPRTFRAPFPPDLEAVLRALSTSCTTRSRYRPESRRDPGRRRSPSGPAEGARGRRGRGS